MNFTANAADSNFDNQASCGSQHDSTPARRGGASWFKGRFGKGWIGVLLVAVASGSGCAAPTVSESQRAGASEQASASDEEVASSEDALRAGGGGHLGYNCSPDGTCECSKEIENDCENMSGICTDGTVNALINCINGWLTTHCTCTKALVGPKPGTKLPVGGVIMGTLSKAAF